MEITKENLHQAITALRQCAKENENRQTDTGAVRVTDICNDVADYLEKEKDKPKKYIVKLSQQYMTMIFLQRQADTAEEKQRILHMVLSDIADWLRQNESKPIFAYKFVGNDGKEHLSWTIENFTDGTDFPMEIKETDEHLIVGLEV